MEHFPLQLGIGLGLALVLLCLVRLALRNSRRRDSNEPVLTEEALVHRKSDFTTRLQTFYFEIWEQLNKGDRGTLCHQGGTFLSFTREGEVFSPNSAARSSGHIT